MKYHKLRIAWSVAWGVVWLLFCALWAGSYLRLTTNEIFVTPSTRYYLHSFSGTVAIQVWPRTFSGAEFLPIFRESDLSSWLTPSVGFRVIGSPGSGIEALSISYWLPSLGALILAVVPWLRFHFRLRTLLIALTLLAVGLGTIVYLRKLPAVPRYDQGFGR
jgi:hypothetical protein